MTGQRDPAYRTEAMASLARQLLYAPADKRVKQVRRAEKLHDQLDGSAQYPLDYVHFKITRYRKEALGEAMLPGGDLLHDLRVLIGELSRSSPLPVTAEEPVESAGELADRLGVTAKTIVRWREEGLRWRWVRRAGSVRRVIGYTGSGVAAFLERYGERVGRASRFTHLGAKAKQGLIDRARELARSAGGGGATLNEVAARLAKDIGRAHETVRLILEHHDRDHPGEAIFVTRRGPIDDKERRRIVRLYRGGVSAAKIAGRFGRGRAVVYRAVRWRRAGVIRRLRIRFVTLAVFERVDADAVILRAQPPDAPDLTEGADRRRAVDGSDLPAPLDVLFGGVRVDAKLQRSLLTRYNYLKHKAVHGRERLHSIDPVAGDLDEIDRWVRRAGAIRDWNFVASLPLVLSVTRRHMLGQDDQSASHLVDLLEVGAGVLAEAIEGFDPGRSEAFSAYLRWRLMREFAAGGPDGQSQRRRARKRLDGPAAFERIRCVAARWGIRLREVGV